MEASRPPCVHIVRDARAVLAPVIEGCPDEGARLVPGGYSCQKQHLQQMQLSVLHAGRTNAFKATLPVAPYP